MADCEACARPQTDTAYVCPDDATKLEDRLRQAAELYAELRITITRQDRVGQRDHVRLSGSEPPLPFRWDASDAQWAIVNTVTTWARLIAEERGLTPPTDPADLMRWLGGQLHWLRYQPQAGEAWGELDSAAALVWRTVDAPAPRWYAGPCGCGQELYVPPGAGGITCRACGAQYDSRARREWLLDQVDDTLAHAALVAQALTALGEPLPCGTVYSWASRGRLVAHGNDRAGRALYRVGDARRLLLEEQARRAKRVGV